MLWPSDCWSELSKRGSQGKVPRHESSESAHAVSDRTGNLFQTKFLTLRSNTGCQAAVSSMWLYSGKTKRLPRLRSTSHTWCSRRKSGHAEVPWIELDGNEVIGNPLLWKPRTDRFNPYTCRACKVQSLQRERVVKHIARQLHMQLPWGNYHAEPARCYRCKREILVLRGQAIRCGR
jgi:hypothetical protein